MEDKDILTVLIDVHNRLLDISVKGDDAVRMGNIITEIRTVVAKVKEQQTVE